MIRIRQQNFASLVRPDIPSPHAAGPVAADVDSADPASTVHALQLTRADRAA